MATIRKVTDEYTELRSLWVQTFGDKAEFVDDFYACWGDDIEGYVLEDEGRIVSALTMFRMGDLVIPEEGVSKPAYISYAICTDTAARGRGFGSQITEFARDVAIERDGVSMLSPAEASLVRFYQPIGYEPRFYAMERTLVCDALEDYPDEIDQLSDATYNSLREELLADTVHIKLSDTAIHFVEMQSDGLYALLDGKVIVATEADSSRFPEVIAASDLEPAEIEAAVAKLAGALGKNICSYRMPGNEYLQSGALGKEYVQAMIARDTGWKFSTGYFGFTFD